MSSSTKTPTHGLARRTLLLVMAGGEGSRLGPLTDERPKPALPYAGVYRLIDLPLSHARHSGIEHVWVLEQYRPHHLNAQLANGRPWDLDRSLGGLRVMPPFQADGEDEEGFAHGNAEALQQHAHFIRDLDPELIVVVSADHLYRLDFGAVLAHHVEHGADVTAVTTEVPRDHARRFAVVESDGAASTDGAERVKRFHYKPDDPPSGTVCTEVFVFTADVLLDTLDELAEEHDELGDYGDHLMPELVDSYRVITYPMSGYWRDVGTVEAYWECHMDLVSKRTGDDAPPRWDDPDWPLLTRHRADMPARLESTARCDAALVSPGCRVAGTVTRSVLAPGVVIGEGAVVEESVVLEDARVEAGAQVRRAIVDSGAVIGAGARVGRAAESADEEPVVALVPGDCEIEAGAVVEPRSPGEYEDD